MGYMGMDAFSKVDFEEMDYLVETLIPSRDEIFVFGHGEYGKSFSNYLVSIGCQINGFIVSGDWGDDDNQDTMTILEFEKYYNDCDKSVLVLLCIAGKYYGEVYPDLMFLKNDLYIVSEKYLQLSTFRCGKTDNITLIIPVVDYCNKIACYGCTAAVPVSQCKSKYSVNEYSNDMKKIKSLVGDKVCHVNFTGGDVFLHGELIEMIEFARELYPEALIDLSTNGISFDLPDENFWIRAGVVGITLNWTLYPVDYKNWGVGKTN